MKLSSAGVFFCCWAALAPGALVSQCSPEMKPIKVVNQIDAKVPEPQGFSTDDEAIRFVEEVIQRVVFESLHEVSLVTSLDVTPGSGRSSEFKDSMREEIARRLERMGLKVVEGEASKRPIVALNLRIVQLPNYVRYLAYFLELAISEKVELKRPSIGEPPARTYTFRSTGYFANENLVPELRTAYGALLDSLRQALEVARQAP